MKISRGFSDLSHVAASGCALTIGNFDGVHRGHQAMLALLRSEAQHRGVPSCVITFEPHPRDYFAALHGKPESAPARIATLRDKLTELARCGIDRVVILPFKEKLAALSAQDFVEKVLVQYLAVRYVLVGDDFCFGAGRAGDYHFLDACGARYGFDVARMNSYEVHGVRVSSSKLRSALAEGDLILSRQLLGRPYSISGHVIHGRKLGRKLGVSKQYPQGFRTLNLRFSSHHYAWHPPTTGIFVVLVHGLTEKPLQGVANWGVRPSLDAHDVNGGRVLLETHCLDWDANLGIDGAYGKIIRVELLHKLHDERKYENLEALTQGITQDCLDARNYFTENT